MAAWAPSFVMVEHRADPDAMANARDIHDATIELIRTMIPYLLEGADTRDLRVWGFIYVTLTFMRSLKTRPELLEWFGSAFHPQLLASFLNMLLREDETRGGPASESACQSEVVTTCSLLKERRKPGKYGSCTEDNIRQYLRAQDEHQKAELVKSSPTAKEVTVKNVTATPEKCTVVTDDESITSEQSISTTKAVILTTGNTAISPEGTQMTAERGTFTLEESAVMTEETTTSDSAHQRGRDTKTPARELLYTSPLPEHHLLRGLFFGGEAAETRRQEEQSRDPPLFPNGWFKNSKYNYDETQVHNYVQSVDMHHDRLKQILSLAAQLNSCLFVSVTDSEGRSWISVPGPSSIPKPDPNKKLPEIVEHDGGIKVVYVHPSFNAAESERDITVTEKLRSTSKTEIQTMSRVQGTDDWRVTKESDTAAAITPTTKYTAKGPHAMARLTEDALKNMLIEAPSCPMEYCGAPNKGSGSDDWEHLSNESHGDDETGQRAQVGNRSLPFRLLFG